MKSALVLVIVGTFVAGVSFGSLLRERIGPERELIAQLVVAAHRIALQDSVIAEASQMMDGVIALLRSPVMQALLPPQERLSNRIAPDGKGRWKDDHGGGVFDAHGEPMRTWGYLKDLRSKPVPGWPEFLGGPPYGFNRVDSLVVVPR